MGMYLTNMDKLNARFVQQAAANTNTAVEWRDHPIPCNPNDPDNYDSDGNQIYFPEAYTNVFGSVYCNEPPNTDLTVFWQEYDRLLAAANKDMR